MMKKYLTACLCVVVLHVNGQKPAQFLRAGDLSVERGEWDEAFSLYQQAWAIDSTSFDLLTRYANAARMVHYYALAEDLYARSFEKDQGKIFPDALFYLAQMEKFNGKYEDAQRNFKKYLKKYKTKGNKVLVQRAEQESKSALWALDYKAPKNILPSAFIEEPVRTSLSEHSGVIQGPYLYYTSNHANGEQFQLYRYHFETKENGLVEIPGLPAGSEIGAITFGDDRAFVSVKNEVITSIYSIVWKNDLAEGEAKQVGEINAEGTINTQPSFVKWKNGASFLFFSSNREAGEGEMDIWYAPVINGAIGKPVNAGKSINTPGNELTPFATDSLFYFASDWHAGFGGSDIFHIPLEIPLKGEPTNAGVPYNSSANDLGYFESSKEFKVILASNRDWLREDFQGATCCTDLIEIKLPRPDLEITKEDSAAKRLSVLMSELPVKLYFHNDEPNPDVWDTTTTLTYLQAYDSYFKLVPQYLKENTKGLSGDKKEEAEQITQDFFDLQVKKGLDDLGLFAKLVLQELQSGQSLKVQVRGFASPRAKSDYNLNLTKRRTASLVNYMREVDNGIFAPYMNGTAVNGAKLEFELIPFGEYKAQKGVSDDLIDEKNSIYARSACLERKIEIENVIFMEKPQMESSIQPSMVDSVPLIAAMSLSSMYHDFGTIRSNKPVSTNIQVTNTGNAPLEIADLKASCGCTEPILSKRIIAPGETADLKIGFNPAGKSGLEQKTVLIIPKNAAPVEIIIQAFVTP